MSSNYTKKAHSNVQVVKIFNEKCCLQAWIKDTLPVFSNRDGIGASL